MSETSTKGPTQERPPLAPLESSTTTTTAASSPSERKDIKLFGLRPRVFGAVKNIEREGDSGDLNAEGVEDLSFDVDLTEANVVTSIAGDRGGSSYRYHYPVLDLDIAARLVPSSTPGHSHLYIDRALTWTQYKRVLEVLGEVGIIEPGYAGASIARGHTAVRLPWVQKKPKAVDLSVEDAPF